MKDQTISSFQGYGYRLQLIKRTGLCKVFLVSLNRRVVINTAIESLAKDVFLNQLSGIVRQTSIQFTEDMV